MTTLTHDENVENTLDSSPANVYGKSIQTTHDLSNILKYGDGSSRDAFLLYLDGLEAHFKA